MATKKTASEDTSKVTTTTAETAAEKKPAAKKTTTKKAATKKTTAEKTTAKEKPEAEKKETKRKVTRKPAKTVVLQYLGKEIDEAEITERAIAQFSALEGGVAVKKITLYLKPEEEAAYYVINDQYTGKVGF